MTQIVATNSTRWGAVPESLLEDKRLSVDSRAVAAWLATKPACWEVMVAPLCLRLGIGRDKWRRIARELEAAGYLRRSRRQNTDGTWGWKLDFSALGDLATQQVEDRAPPQAEHHDATPPPPSTPKREAPSCSASTILPSSGDETNWIELEIEAANLAYRQGKGKPIHAPSRFRAFLAKKINEGSYEPSFGAAALAAAREAEAARQQQLGQPPPNLPHLPQRHTSPAAALKVAKGIVGIC